MTRNEAANYLTSPAGLNMEASEMALLLLQEDPHTALLEKLEPVLEECEKEGTNTPEFRNIVECLRIGKWGPT